MAKISQKNQKNTSSKPTTKAKRSRKSVPRDSPPQRSSIYRGVTRHRLTGRYEAHLWDKNCWNESQNKKGRQGSCSPSSFDYTLMNCKRKAISILLTSIMIDFFFFMAPVMESHANAVYLGAYEDEEAAAHAYDLAALKYWGQDTILNFPLSTYKEELEEMEGQSKEEYIGSLRRKSSGFSRGVSKYRGVARHHHNGRWEARIGRVFGNKYLYLGTYATQEEAAMAYDMAAIEYRGLNAVTNFDLSRYVKWLRPNKTNNPTITQQNPNGDSNSIQNPNQDHGLHSSASLNDNQTSNVSESPGTDSGGASASSALGFLLQSPKFKEMLERTSSTDCPSTPPAEPCPARRSFPDDIQTYFDCQDGDDIIFGELDYSFASPMFDCELDMMRVNYHL